FFSFYINRIYIFNKILSLFILYLFGFCLMATQSRTGAIMALLSIVFLLYINHKQKAFIMVIGTLVLVAVLVQLFIPGLLYRYSVALDMAEQGNRDASKAGRIGVWQNAIDVVSRGDPVLIYGYGLSRIGKVALAGGLEGEGSAGPMNRDDIVDIGDNYFLQLLFTVGFLGPLLFFWILFSAFKESMRLYKAENDLYLKCLLGGISSIIVIFTFQGFFSQLWELFPNNLYFWFLLGLLVSIRYIKKTDIMHIPNPAGETV
ncbi:MAG: O-antigen ligase family protein, partial [bacterium]